ncbi:MAG: hypothetical protein HKN34_05580 [Gammaproteobacteria bacterium]|nr:hypothetical protein [Gammaproteobacteria bacterium]
MRRLIELPVLTLFLTATLSTISMAEEESYWSWLFTLESRKGVAPVTEETYLEVCGDCHVAYQPGLLPKASWEMLLARDTVADHFGTPVKLDEEVRLEILESLRAYSADSSRYKRSKKIMASLSDGSVPSRITDIPYIKKKHHAVIEKVGAKVGKFFSLNRCIDCHLMGSLSDDSVPITITDIANFEKMHAVVEIMPRKSDKIFPLYRCDDCHQKAREGIYDDDTVFIPGYGYYTD